MINRHTLGARGIKRIAAACMGLISSRKRCWYNDQFKWSQNIQVVTHVRRSPTICDYLYLEEALEEAVINDFETIYQAVIICLRELLGSSSRLTSMRRGDLSMTAGTVGWLAIILRSGSCGGCWGGVTSTIMLSKLCWYNSFWSFDFAAWSNVTIYNNLVRKCNRNKTCKSYICFE